MYEWYKNNLLSSERLQSIMKYCNEYMNISSKLIKRLIRDRNVPLLDINHFKFYDNDFILQLLMVFKNKTTMSTSDFNQQVLNEKFKILINTNNINNIKTFYLKYFN